MSDTGKGAPRPNHGAFQMAVDYLPVVAFVVVYFVGGRKILPATAALVAGSLIAIIASLIIRRRLALLPAVYGGAALVFGGLTLFLHDPNIVKMKTTFIDLGLGLFLLIGLARKKNPLVHLMSGLVPLTEKGVRTLTLRFGIFFLLMAGLNEIVWRTQPESTWVLFRMPGLVILSLVFALAQTPLMLRESHHDPETPPDQS
jgi:intracellular septation protein